MPKITSKDSIGQSTKELPNTLWGKIRKQLITLYAEAIDISWFSKIEATENEQTKEINLKVSSEFIKDWIERNYEQAIEQTAGAMGIRIRGFEC